MKEHGDKFSAEEKKAIEDLIPEVRTVAEGDDAEAINAKVAELTAAVMKMGEAIYANASPEDDATASGSDDDEDIVDAEFEDVEDDDKA